MDYQIQKIRNEYKFFCELLEFFCNIHDSIQIDFYLKQNEKEFEGIENFLVANWFVRKLLKRPSYLVNKGNLIYFLNFFNNKFREDIIWGCVNANKEPLFFNGYGNNIITTYNNNEEELIKKLLESLKREGIIDIYYPLCD